MNDNKRGGIIPIAAFFAAVPGIIAAAAPYIATGAAGATLVAGITHAIREIKDLFSGKRGNGLYEPFFDDETKGAGCSCHKGLGVYDPVYSPELYRSGKSQRTRKRSSNSVRESGLRSLARSGYYNGEYYQHRGGGVRDPVYGRGEDVLDILKGLSRKTFEKIAELLRDEIINLPGQLKHKIVNHFIKEGNVITGSGVW